MQLNLIVQLFCVHLKFQVLCFDSLIFYFDLIVNLYLNMKLFTLNLKTQLLHENEYSCRSNNVYKSILLSFDFAIVWRQHIF